MPDTFEIVSASSRYSILVGENLLADIIARYPDAIYIVDANVNDRLPPDLTRRVIVDAIEDNKSLEKSVDYVAAIRGYGAHRDTHLVAIGGGIVQDIVTFLASIYMRGLTWTYVPTTVLAMVDSCIGGKSSLNAQGYKNLVGNFYPPNDIVIDLHFVTTLDREMIVGGLFESAKICFAKDSSCFAHYQALGPEQAKRPGDFASIVNLSLRTKKWFIEIDEFDRKERLLLNFGHTFGHAIEAATEFSVSHGIGVGAGMLCACAFAEANGLLDTQGRARVEQLKTHIYTMLSTNDEAVAPAPPPIDLGFLLQKFEHDKKHKADHYRLVLPQHDGALALVSIAKTADTHKAIRQSFMTIFDALSWPYRASEQ